MLSRRMRSQIRQQAGWGHMYLLQDDADTFRPHKIPHIKECYQILLMEKRKVFFSSTQLSLGLFPKLIMETVKHN